MKHRVFLLTFVFGLFSQVSIAQETTKVLKNDMAINVLPLVNKEITKPTLVYRHYFNNQALRVSVSYKTARITPNNNLLESIAVQDTQIAFTEIASSSNALTVGIGYEWHGKKMLENKPHVYGGAELIAGFGQIYEWNATHYYKLKDGVYEKVTEDGVAFVNTKTRRDSDIFQAGLRPYFGVQIPFGKRFFAASELLTPMALQSDSDRISQKNIRQFYFETNFNVLIGIRI